jgi:hypothetical protein
MINLMHILYATDPGVLFLAAMNEAPGVDVLSQLSEGL